MILRVWRAIRYPMVVVCLAVAIIVLCLIYKDWKGSTPLCPDGCMTVAILLFMGTMAITLWMICVVVWLQGDSPIPLLVGSAFLASVGLIWAGLHLVQIREPIRIRNIRGRAS